MITTDDSFQNLPTFQLWCYLCTGNFYSRFLSLATTWRFTTAKQHWKTGYAESCQYHHSTTSNNTYGTVVSIVTTWAKGTAEIARHRGGINSIHRHCSHAHCSSIHRHCSHAHCRRWFYQYTAMARQHMLVKSNFCLAVVLQLKPDSQLCCHTPSGLYYTAYISHTVYQKATVPNHVCKNWLQFWCKL